jgi:hypothetical protein
MTTEPQSQPAEAPGRISINPAMAARLPITDRRIGDVEYIRADLVLDVIDKAGQEWSERARNSRSKTYSAYAIAALDLRGRVEEAAKITGKCIHCDSSFVPTGPDDWCYCVCHQKEAQF